MARKATTRGGGTRRRPGRPANEADAPDRRTALAESALDLFADSGFERVSVKQVAARAGVDPALIYYYFGGKQDLFVAALEHAVETGLALFRRLEGGSDDPRRTIAAWLDCQEKPASTIPKMARMALDHRRSGADLPEADRLIRRFYAEERRLLADAVRRGLATGVFRDVEPAAFARFVSTLLDGAMVRQVIQNISARAAIDRLRPEVWRHLGTAPPDRRR